MPILKKFKTLPNSEASPTQENIRQNSIEFRTVSCAAPKNKKATAPFYSQFGLLKRSAG
jgi:hypothetical protein